VRVPSSVLTPAFTLIELLVVIGLIAVLAGLLLPAIENVRKGAQAKTQRLNFRAIIGALEAYRQDFRDYPKDSYALTDGVNTTTVSFTNTGGATASLPDLYRPVPFHTDPTLAMALLGLGPASAVGSPQYNNGDVDGADGPGFKAKMAVVATGTVSASAGTAMISVSQLNVNLSNGSPPFLPAVNATALPPAFTVVSLGGPGSPDAQVPIVSATTAPQGSTTSITLSRALVGSYSGQACALLAPAGKTYEPYLPPDKFKVQYVMVPAANQGKAAGVTNAEETQALPVLLDIWGGPILYFPAYNTYSTRLPSTSTYLTNTPTATSTAVFPALILPPAGVIASAGPIFGSPSPNTAYIAKNAPVDNANDTIPAIFWSGPLGSWGPGANNPTPSSAPLAADPAVPLTQGQIQGILLKLGDADLNNVITNSPVKETFNLQQPYFLVSPGPDGKFEDPIQDALNDKQIFSATNPPGAAAAAYMSKTDDVYDFDQ
jgi:prepilin-type N-terminal cleavage/methylation domain-containing protein